MDPFAYLSVLTSIVLALGITQILTGLGRLLQARGRVGLYWVHLLWALNVFLFLVLNWWILYRWHTQTTWTFFLFLFVLLSPTVAFLLTMLLFPDPLSPGDRPQATLLRQPPLVLCAGGLACPDRCGRYALEGPRPLLCSRAFVCCHSAVCLCFQYHSRGNPARRVSQVLRGLLLDIHSGFYRDQPAIVILEAGLSIQGTRKARKMSPAE